MGISETVRRQEEQLASQAKQHPQKPQPVAQPAQQPVVDLHAFRQIVEEVVRAELQTLRAEQPAPQDSQPPIDMQALQAAVRTVVRAELQGIQTTLTILTNAIQARTDALTCDTDDVDQEQDDLLPTAPPHRTDDEESEDEQGYPPNEDDDEDIDEEGELDEEEEGEGGGESYPRNPPRPESPTHQLRRPGPVGILLGDGIRGRHPSDGKRRWEQQG